VTGFLKSRATRWFVVALALLLFAVSNLPWHLDDYDQAKQAFTSFEMVEQGHWFYQHTPNGWMATKPPLVGWISAGFFAATRSWEIAWRLPSFLAAAALLVLLARAGGVYGRVPALVAVCAFAFNLFVPRLASLVRTDMPLALVLFATGWLIWEKIRKRETWTTQDRLLLFLLLSAGMLIKGPIVYAFLLPGIIAFQWRERKTEKMPSAWSGWPPWLASLAIFGVWIGAGVQFVPEFLEHVVQREFAGRFSEETHRPQPFYFYLPHLLHRWAPWSLLLIALPFVASRKKALGSAESRPARMMSPETFWLLAWSLGGLLVMSCIPSKRVDRIFPIVPPLCLLLAAVVGGFRRQEKMRVLIDRVCLTAIILAWVGITGYGANRIAVARRGERDAFATFGREVMKKVADNGWRYSVVGGDDEGMALYVRRTEFAWPDEAAADWNAGKLDALVVADDEVDGLLGRLEGPSPQRVLTSQRGGKYKKRYLLLARPFQT
jgi:4-amino-4-deoxy-L-arabinose transferase-like glycosyltransferase